MVTPRCSLPSPRRNPRHTPLYQSDELLGLSAQPPPTDEAPLARYLALVNSLILVRGYISSAIRSLALRERGLRANSSALGVMGLRVIIRHGERSEP